MQVSGQHHTLGERVFGTQWIGGLLSPIASLDAVVKRKGVHGFHLFVVPVVH
jgi:hypothetical protein